MKLKKNHGKNTNTLYLDGVEYAALVEICKHYKKTKYIKGDAPTVYDSLLGVIFMGEDK